MSATTLRVVHDDRRPFFTPKMLAEYLSISDSTVRQLLFDGAFEATKVGRGLRIWADSVDAYLAANRQEGTERRRALPHTTGPYDAWKPDERDYAAILLHDPCSYCGAKMEAVDHISPRARAGVHEWANFTASCRPCNSSKCARPLLAFLLWRLA